MRSFAICAAIVAGLAAAPQPQTPVSLTAVMDLASRFAVRQRDMLTSVRADELYTQELRAPGGGVLETRQLESEMAFVQLSDREEWLAFRNVLRVDGTPTGTDTSRLEKLFREGAAAGQGRRIADESARYNLGGLHRTLNVPTVVTHLLMPRQIERFRFKKLSEHTTTDGVVWVVSYEERDRPTIVRTTTFRDVPLKGRLWLVADDGRLLRATVEAHVLADTELEFSWRHDARLDAWVPDQMRERYRRIRDDKSPDRKRYDIEALATYTNYRRFGVDVRVK